MATYQEIVNKVNDIADNGNNTAAEVRSVLTEMLNFSNDGFEIATPTAVFNDTQSYFYSFKGVKNQCCNLFIALTDRRPRTDASTNLPSTSNILYTIEIARADYDILKSFIPQYGDTFDGNMYLSFIAPTLTVQPRNIAITLYTYNDRFYVLIGTNTVGGNETIITTIPLNFKKIVLPNSNRTNDVFIKEFKTLLVSKDFFGFDLNSVIK